MYSYRIAGVSLPRVSRDQYRLGSKAPLTALLPGDLLFWAHNTADPATVHHVAMYVGSGRVVHAPHPERGSGWPPTDTSTETLSGTPTATTSDAGTPTPTEAPTP
jgi:cell wall-associated NlpC family hydrolase